jgi:hypothetical protein
MRWEIQAQGADPSPTGDCPLHPTGHALASASVREYRQHGSGCRMALVVVREAVIRDFIPGRPGGDEGVELRANAGLAIERPEADRDFFALRPFRAEQTRAADRAKGLHAAAVGPEDADQLLTRKQAEPCTRDASLRPAEGARVLSASRTVAVIGPAKGRRHREADATAEARAVKWVLRARLCGRVRWTRPGHDEESLDRFRARAEFLRRDSPDPSPGIREKNRFEGSRTSEEIG